MSRLFEFGLNVIELWYSQ